MPSSKEPFSAVAPSQPPFSSGSGSAGFARSADLLYSGGPDWADATPNPPTTVEDQLDKIITDLATGSGAGKIQYNGSGNDFADTSNLAAGDLQTVLDTLVSTLGSITDTTSGADRIGVGNIFNPSITIPQGRLINTLGYLSEGQYLQYTDTGVQFLNGDPLLDSDLDSTINDIVNHLSSEALNNSGAHIVGTYDRTSWIDGTTNPATDIFSALDKIISDLASSTVNASGAHKLRIDARPTWLDTISNPASDLASAVDKIITDLSSTATGITDGASKIGAAAVGSFSSGTLRSQLNALDTGWGKLNRANSWSAIQTFTTTSNFNVSTPDTSSNLASVATPTNRALLYEFRHTSTAYGRLYARRENGATTDGYGLEYVFNAVWGGSSWSADDTSLPSHIYEFGYDDGSESGFDTYAAINLRRRDAGAGTWTSWQAPRLRILPENPAPTAAVNGNTLSCKNINKAWGHISLDGAGNATLDDGFGVSSTVSVTSGASGYVTVTFTVSLVGGYVVVGADNRNSTTLRHVKPANQVTGSFRLHYYDATGTILDPSTTSGVIAFIVMGVQTT